MVLSHLDASQIDGRMLFFLGLVLTASALSPVLPEVADTAEGIAAQLVLVEAVIREESHASDAVLYTHGHLQQVIYRHLALEPSIEAATMEFLPEEVQRVARANVGAAREAMGAIGWKRTTMPTWRIVEPAPAAELLSYYREAEREFGVPWEILAAIHLVETRMGRLRGISIANAAGPMQFIPETWERFGEGDIEDNRDAIRAAARYLKFSGAPENIDKALWHYNPTDHYVRSVRAYAGVMEANPLAYRGYYGWQVYYTTIRGYLWLDVGYAEEDPVSVVVWCETHACPE